MLYVSSWLYVPLRLLGAPAAVIERELTIRPVSLSTDSVPPEPIPMFDNSVPGYLGVPIDWGLRRYGNLQIEDRTSMGRRIRVPKIPDPYHAKASEGQADFMAELLAVSQTCYAFLAKAGTGTGKTVSALWLAAMRGRSTLIVVHSTALLKQWTDEIHDKLGVPRDQIGVIRQDKCQYKKPFVVALVHTIVRRDYPEEVTDAFGTVIYDEVHRMGAASFSQSIGMFTAQVKLAMTATENRKDKADKVYFWYFGAPSVLAEAKALACQVKVLKHKCMKPFGEGARAIALKCLESDKQRNQKILKLVAELYDIGRYVLVIGDSIRHLQTLLYALYSSGIPMEHMGMFTGSYYPATVVGGKTKFSEKSKPIKQDELTRIKEDPEVCIVFATYGSFKEGVDIPRLDAGVDVTPRTEGVQVLGRIRRKHKNKPMPIWYTIDDVAFEMFKRYTKARVKDYLSSGNVELLNDDYKPTTKKG